MKKRNKGFMLSKETVRNLTMPVLDQEMAAIIAGTAGGTPSKPNSFPCCMDLLPQVVPQVRRKPRKPRK